jgi:hypothetical protein
VLAPRSLDLHLRQPSDFLQRISTKHVQSLTLSGCRSLQAAAVLQQFQLPELRELCLQDLYEEEQQQEQQQGQQQEEQAQLVENAAAAVAAAEAAAAEQLASALSTFSSLRKFTLDFQLPAAAIDMLPAGLQELTLFKLPVGASCAQLTQLRQLHLRNPCCDAAGLAAVVASAAAAAAGVCIRI